MKTFNYIVCTIYKYILLFAELPVPVLGDLSEVTLLAQRLHRGNPAKLSHTYSDICNLDTIEVNLVPEKKGIFLKHVEYQVTSKVYSHFSFMQIQTIFMIERAFTEDPKFI